MNTRVTVHTGELEGIVEDGIAHFRAVPYARAARFEAAQEPESWSGVRDATRHGPICPQPRSRLERVMGSPEPRQRRSSRYTIVLVSIPMAELSAAGWTELAMLSRPIC